MSESHLILASGSPRRRELMALMGIDFTVCPVDVDEHLSGHPADVVMALAEKKAEAAAALHPGETVTPARAVESRSFNSNLYVERMIMNNGTDAQGLASAMAAAQRRTMSGYGS